MIAEKMLLHNSLCYAKTEFAFLQRQNDLKNEPAQTYIEKLLYLIDTQINFVERLLISPNSHDPPTEKIRWHGSRIEFVELVYALHEVGSFGKTTLKKAFLLLGDFFDFEILN